MAASSSLSGQREQWHGLVEPRDGTGTMGIMPLRSLFVILACIATTATGAVAMSWRYGPHHNLETVVAGMLTIDTPVSGPERNLSPYCFTGSCPRVEITTRLDRNLSETERWVRKALERRGYEAVDGGASYRLDGVRISYDITKDGSSGARIHWSAEQYR